MKHRVSKKDYIWNPSACAFEINRYLRSTADGLVITWNYNTSRNNM